MDDLKSGKDADCAAKGVAVCAAKGVVVCAAEKHAVCAAEKLAVYAAEKRAVCAAGSGAVCAAIGVAFKDATMLLLHSVLRRLHEALRFPSRSS